MNRFFESIQLGPYSLQNRIAMAPLTRRRATSDHIPTPVMAEYYAQRASAGLIISEAAPISPQAVGYMNIPGIYTPAQAEAWKPVTNAVHQKKGCIFMQLWHVGRVSHPSMQPEGQLPVSASAIGIDEVINTPGGHLKMVTPRALTVPEIKSTVEDYANAARLAMEAGFDGVEIHSANSYLLEQFLHSSSNIRTDAYGGSIENRCRLVFEVVEAVISEVGAHRTGIRLSPSNIKNGMDDPDPVGLYGHLVCGLNRYGLAYLHLVEPMLPLDNYPHMLRDVAGHFRKTWKGILISCGNYDYEKGLQRLASGDADMIAYGRLFIANPDLPERFRKQAPLNVPDPETFYYGGNRGYLDYPFMDE